MRGTELKSAEFYDQYAKALNMEQYREDARWKVQALLQVLPKEKRFRWVLEVGCGPALVLKGVADAVGTEYRAGVDISQEMLDLAVLEQGGMFKQVDVGRRPLPYANKSFDLVILSDILEHVKESSFVLDEACRVGKAVVMKIPAEKGWRNRKLDEHKGGHVHLWSVDEVQQKLEDAVAVLGAEIKGWRAVEPPTRIQWRNWKWRWTVNPLYWFFTGLNWFAWTLCRPLWRKMHGTTVVAYMEVEE